MKKLPIYDPLHKQYIEDFTLYLQLVGYGEGAWNMFPRSLREYLHWIEQYNYPLHEITKKELKHYYQYLEERPNERGGILSEMTIAHYMYAIRIFYTYLEETKQINTNPFSSIELPKAEYNRRSALNRNEIQALYKAAETHRDKAILSLFYGCGLRRSEAEKLNVKDISFTSNILYVREGKGKKRREIPLNQKVKTDLENYYHKSRTQYLKQAGEPAFILGDKGRRMLGQTYVRHLQRLIQMTKDQSLITRQVSPHYLRHSIATHLLENGLSVEKVRDFLGHKEIDTTEIYTHINQQIPL